MKVPNKPTKNWNVGSHLSQFYIREWRIYRRWWNWHWHGCFEKNFSLSFPVVKKGQGSQTAAGWLNEETPKPPEEKPCDGSGFCGHQTDLRLSKSIKRQYLWALWKIFEDSRRHFSLTPDPSTSSRSSSQGNCPYIRDQSASKHPARLLFYPTHARSFLSSRPSFFFILLLFSSFLLFFSSRPTDTFGEPSLPIVSSQPASP